MENSFNYVTNQLGNLNTDRNPKYWGGRTKGRAPHKVFLLLSIIDGLEQGWISDNKITLSQDLVETFFTYWNAIMGEEKVTSVSLPFFYMKSESFWKLQYKSGKKEFSNAPSLGGLRERVMYAQIEQPLFDLISHPLQKEQIRSFLIDTYFSSQTGVKVAEIGSLNIQSYFYSKQLEAFAAEPFEMYHTKGAKEKYKMGKVQVRQSGFARMIKTTYKYTCAICRDRVVTPSGEALVEGAHIIPWSKSKNDDPRNGVSLCRSHHWMFDSFMLTVDTNYRVILSQWLNKKENEIGDFKKWDKESILLPDERFHPSKEALHYHNATFYEYQNSF